MTGRAYRTPSSFAGSAYRTGEVYVPTVTAPNVLGPGLRVGIHATLPAMGHPSYRVRPVTRADLAGVAKLASELVQFHHELDPRRFFHVDNAEEGYAWWLGTQLGNPSSAVVCAVDDADRVVGYAYGTKEGRDWNMLVDEHGIVHDVLVERSARRAGVGEMLLKDVCARLRALGAPRVLLYTAVNNTAARSLFARIGFRETMVEMTREGDDGG